MAFHPLKCVYGNFVIYQRYVMVIMMQFALLHAYHLRVVLNIAITEMVQSSENETTFVDACPNYKYEKIEEIKGGSFDWDPEYEAAILYAFFCSYFISHIPGGSMADQIGARHVMGVCLVVSSIATILLPFSIQMFGGLGAIVLRVVLGFFQGPLLPSISSFLQHWVPKNQRAFLGGIAFGGSNMGTVTGSIFTGWMIHGTGSWMVPFYVWGLLGLVHCVFHYLLVFSAPKFHPFITDEEKEYLLTEVEPPHRYNTPWLQIIKSPVLYGLLAGQFAHNFIFFTLLTYLPKYLKDILKMSVKSNAMTTALPFLSLWVSIIIFAYVSDFIINHGWMRPIVARKLYTAFACIVPSGMIVLITYIGCNREAAQVLIAVSFFLVGPFFSGMKVNVNDITINFGGTIMAIVNGLGSLAGVIGPYMIGALTKDHSLEAWQLCMWVVFIVSSTLSLIYCCLTSAERQPFDFIEPIES